MHHDQGVGRLSPAHVVNNVAADCGGQVVVAGAIDVCLHHASFDNVHAVVREAQHVAVADRELKRHQAHAIGSAWGAAVWQLKHMLGAGPATQSALGLDQHIGSLGQGVAVCSQVNPCTQQRVKLAGRKVGGELDKAWHQFLTAIRL